MSSARKSTLAHRVWRWHFFAGLLVIPFVLILALSGSLYLFKPQLEQMIESQINARALPVNAGSKLLPADALTDIALIGHEDGQLKRYILPSSPSDPTAELELSFPGGAKYLWIDRTSGKILHEVPSQDRVMEVIKRIHGTLLGGNVGSLIVEIMACWSIVLVLTGLFLWWPRTPPFWRVFVPDFKAAGGKRALWKKLHGATGAWVSILVLIMLFSGLPWTQVWGDGFTRAKALAGLRSPGQEWFVTLQSADPHAMHEMGASLWETSHETDTPPAMPSTHDMTHLRSVPLQSIVRKATDEGISAPVQIQPPRGENGVWTVRGLNANRLKQETIHYDQWTGDEVMRIRFQDHNIVDRITALGVSFHEGALFGWVNQLLGLLAAFSLILLSVTGGLMWWKRRPARRIGIPPMPTDRRVAAGVVGLILFLGIFLPMAGVTLCFALLMDCLWSLLRRFV